LGRKVKCFCVCKGKYPAPALAVDGIVPYEDGVVLIRRGNEPFKGKLALPGGFVECGETVEEAVAREVREETGLRVRPAELVGVYSDPERDPRGHVVSVCFLCEVEGGELRAGSDAADVEVVDPEDLSPEDLAFDHYQMLRDAGLVD